MRNLNGQELLLVAGGEDDLGVDDIKMDAPTMRGISIESGGGTAEQGQACANDINGSAGIGFAGGGAIGGVVAAGAVAVGATPIGAAVIVGVVALTGGLAAGGATAKTSPNCNP
ncbi:hypothetical protein [Dyella flagellata]|uniref:Bacteriocin n=1 Tax=Dyella flagellata TaxID=1867833 RepID=A0ABQ5XEN1_9GAMM|nr:hypothetical protein [Dyella flagellata]GLQ89757.1 hypothetical protein GCM10007898_33320 [Dyella flagellata]